MKPFRKVKFICFPALWVLTLGVTLEMIFNELKRVNKRLETIEYLLVQCKEPREIRQRNRFRELRELINGIK